MRKIMSVFNCYSCLVCILIIFVCCSGGYFQLKDDDVQEADRRCFCEVC